MGGNGNDWKDMCIEFLKTEIMLKILLWFSNYLRKMC